MSAPAASPVAAHVQASAVALPAHPSPSPVPSSSSPSALPDDGLEPSDMVRCQWGECHLEFASPSELFEHLGADHVGRKSTRNLCLTCHWAGCGVVCAKRDHITSHLRVHTPLKPHACPRCGKAFKRPQDLKKHARTHNFTPSLLSDPGPAPGPGLAAPASSITSAYAADPCPSPAPRADALRTAPLAPAAAPPAYGYAPVQPPMHLQHRASYSVQGQQTAPYNPQQPYSRQPMYSSGSTSAYPPPPTLPTTTSSSTYPSPYGHHHGAAPASIPAPPTRSMAAPYPQGRPPRRPSQPTAPLPRLLQDVLGERVPPTYDAEMSAFLSSLPPIKATQGFHSPDSSSNASISTDPDLAADWAANLGLDQASIDAILTTPLDTFPCQQHQPAHSAPHQPEEGLINLNKFWLDLGTQVASQLPPPLAPPTPTEPAPFSAADLASWGLTQSTVPGLDPALLEGAPIGPFGPLSVGDRYGTPSNGSYASPGLVSSTSTTSTPHSSGAHDPDVDMVDHTFDRVQPSTATPSFWPTDSYAKVNSSSYARAGGDTLVQLTPLQRAAPTSLGSVRRESNARSALARSAAVHHVKDPDAMDVDEEAPVEDSTGRMGISNLLSSRPSTTGFNNRTANLSQSRGATSRRIEDRRSPTGLVHLVAIRRILIALNYPRIKRRAAASCATVPAPRWDGSMSRNDESASTPGPSSGGSYFLPLPPALRRTSTVPISSSYGSPPPPSPSTSIYPSIPSVVSPSVPRTSVSHRASMTLPRLSVSGPEAPPSESVGTADRPSLPRPRPSLSGYSSVTSSHRGGSLSGTSTVGMGMGSSNSSSSSSMGATYPPNPSTGLYPRIPPTPTPAAAGGRSSFGTGASPQPPPPPSGHQASGASSVRLPSLRSLLNDTER